MKPTSLLLLALSLAYIISPLSAQIPANANFIERGILPTSSLDPGDQDAVNMQTGFLLYNIPLYRFPAGHAGSTFDFGLVYNSAIWGPATPPYSYTPDAAGGGWKYSAYYELFWESRSIINCTSAPRANRLSVVFPDGSRHLLHLKGAVGNPLGSSVASDSEGYYDYSPRGYSSCGPEYPRTTKLVYYSSDSTFIRVEVEVESGKWTLFFPDGSRVLNDIGSGASVTFKSNNKIIDRNGNQTSVQVIHLASPVGDGEPRLQITDSTGRTLTMSAALDPQGVALDTITASGYNNQSIAWKVQWAIFNPAGAVCLPDGPPACGGVYAVESIKLPTVSSSLERKYSFVYDSIWAGLQSVTTPDGALQSFTYDWRFSAANNGIPNGRVKTRTVNWQEDSGLLGTNSFPRQQIWTYDFSTAPSLTASDDISTRTAPDGGVTSYTYCQLPSALVPQKTLCRRQEPNGDALVQKWARNCPFQIWNTQSGNPYVKTEFRTFGSRAAIREFQVDRNGKPLSETSYNWFPASLIGSYTTGDATVLRTVSNSFFLTTEASLAGNCGSSPTNAIDDVNAYWNSRPGQTLSSLIGTDLADPVGTVVSRKEFTYDAPATTANIVTERSWRSRKDDGTPNALTSPLTNQNSAVLSQLFDQKGNLTSRTDPRGTVTTFTRTQCGNSALSSQTVSGLTTSFVWDCATGRPTSTTDPNQSVTDLSYDILGRPLLRREAVDTTEERRTRYQYTETSTATGALYPLTVKIDQDLRAKEDFALPLATQQFDQRGRLALSKSADAFTRQLGPFATGGFTYTASSNPYRTAADPTMGWTRTKFDTNGRPVETAHFETTTLPPPWINSGASPASTTTQTYVSGATLSTDQAAKFRWVDIDALGRTVGVVVEPGDPCQGSPGTLCKTRYTYDPADRLTQVQQDSQQFRTFAYDSLGNLVSAQNPETGLISYRTDANGNVTYQSWDRENSQPVSINRSYDSLNRLTSVTYSGAPTPPVTYCYDGNSTGACDGALTGSRRLGRLSSVINRIGRQDYGSWDALGRLQNSRHTILGGAYAFSYGYANWLGDRPKSQVYPSGKQIVYDFDTYSRPLQTTGYATINTFSPAGQPTQTTLANNVIETAEYNRRLQPTLLTAGPGMRLEYSYGTSTNNGNVQSQRIQRTAGWSAMQYYNYDSANRLAIAAERPSPTSAPSACNEAGLEWCHQYSYDFFGNRLISNRLNSVAGTTEPTSFNLANNRVANAGWDFTKDGLLKTTPSPATTFTYDAEGRQVTAGEELYGYDGTGARVWRRLLGGQTRTYVYDGFGRLATEVGSPGSAGRVYLSNDHLGSVRLVTNADGSVRSCRDFEPFGVRMDASGGNRRGTAPCYSAPDFGTSLEFTGKERDAETGLDYFGARYLSATQGRFTSPDPPALDQSEDNPQSWNLYSYVRNNPLRSVDPTGNECVDLDNGTQGDDGKGAECNGAQLNTTQSVTVEGQRGNAVVALGLNAFFALSATANAFFDPLLSGMGGRPSYMQDNPTNREITGQAATAAVFVATSLGSGGVRGIWTSTSKLSGVKNAFSHWVKHKKDFPSLQNAKQYVETAQGFVTNPPTGTLTKVRPNGDTILYNPGTNTFAVKAADGTPRTMFKPNLGLTYFHSQ